MTELVALSPAMHGKLKVDLNSTINLAKIQHMINLRVIEVSQAASSFPVFISKLKSNGAWVLSAVVGLEAGKNLFIKDDLWDAIFQPSALQTYPLHLMQSTQKEDAYTVGIDPDSEAFSEHSGEPLFDGQGQASLYLSRVTTLLEASIKNDLHTHQFMNKLDELGLIKSIDVLVVYENNKVNTLKGLHTIDEDKLVSLSSEQFEELRKLGYLAPIYASLISLFQLNQLLQRNNQLQGTEKIVQVKMEVAKDSSDL